jgi:hypothetical protein
VSIRASAGRFAIVTVDDGAAPRAMPNQGASSGFKYGGAVGAIEAVLACCEIPMTGIEPSAWKKGHRLRGKDKEGGWQTRLAAVSCPTRAAETLAWARWARRVGADCIIRGAAVILLVPY